MRWQVTYILLLLLLSGALSDECEAWHTVRYAIEQLKSEITKANSKRLAIGVVVCCLREAPSRHMTAHYEAACVSRVEFCFYIHEFRLSEMRSFRNIWVCIL